VSIKRPTDAVWNAASARYQVCLDLLNSLDLNDPESVAGVVEATMREDFVREDRRRLIAVPSVGRDLFAEAVRAWAEMGLGRPTFRVTDVIDVAGDRLVVVAISIDYESGQSVEMLQVVLFDEPIERTQRLVSFDRDDYDAAATELEVLFSEVQDWVEDN
jgi:hypothetical protein